MTRIGDPLVRRGGIGISSRSECPGCCQELRTFLVRQVQRIDQKLERVPVRTGRHTSFQVADSSGAKVRLLRQFFLCQAERESMASEQGREVVTRMDVHGT